MVKKCPKNTEGGEGFMFVIMLVYIGAMLDLCGRCQPVLVHLGTIPDYYRVLGVTPITSYSRERG